MFVQKTEKDEEMGQFGRRRAWKARSAIISLLLAILGFIAVWPASRAGTAAGVALGLPDTPAAQPALIELGRRLFVDKRLSAHGRMACATCHDPAKGFTQNDRPTPDGADGQPLRRNASTLLNVAYASPLMHDGAAPSLQTQMLTPLFDRNEMANAGFAEVEQRLSAMPAYAAAFQAVFGEEPSIATLGAALAAYQRSLVSGRSAFDRWKYGGEAGALPADAQRGFAIFTGKGGCVSCHAIGETSALLTDNLMHNTGVSAAAVARDGDGIKIAGRATGTTIDFASAGDRGRHEVTQDPADLYRFRTPTLRNVALTAPYMHDGSHATLEDVVRFYNRGGGANANLDPAIKPLGLDDREVSDVVAFLRSLTGDNVETLAAEAAAAAASLNP